MNKSTWIFREAMTVALFLTVATNAYAQDASLGKKVFAKCKACHMVGPKAKNRLGPKLNDIIGRKAASMEGFKYSKAMLKAAKEGLIWNEEKLDQYLTKPRELVPQTRMAFPGLPKEDDRKNVIAYLKTFSKAE